MGYGMDYEDVGGFYADRDYEAEMCAEYYGDCCMCPLNEQCEYAEE